MSELRRPAPPRQEFDREIGVRAIVQFGVWLTVTVIVVLILVYGMYRRFQKEEVARDVPPSPLVDRTQRRLPPEPRLQVTPERDLQAYRQEQERQLASYGWVDEKLGIAHVPVERAIEMLLERGAPAPAGGKP